MSVIDAGYFREVFWFSAVFLHILDPCISKNLRRHRSLVPAYKLPLPLNAKDTSRFSHDLQSNIQRCSMSRKLILQTPYHYLCSKYPWFQKAPICTRKEGDTCLHLFPPHTKNTIHATFNGISAHPKRRATRRTIIIDIHDRNLCHSQLIQYSLSTRTISIDIPAVSLLNRVVR